MVLLATVPVWWYAVGAAAFYLAFTVFGVWYICRRSVPDPSELPTTQGGPPVSDVTFHRTTITTDVNRKLTIEGFDVAAGGAPSVYRIGHADSPAHVELMFHTLERAGVTNEALLAVLLDRLNAFQDGPLACAENQQAILGIGQALAALKSRTRRRTTAGIEGQLVEPEKSAGETRVKVDGGKLLVSDRAFDVETLQQTWGAWAVLESVLKKLDPPPTAAELAIVEALATTQPAKNGFSELKQALAQTGRQAAKTS
jgi:hypothetical protein